MKLHENLSFVVGFCSLFPSLASCKISPILLTFHNHCKNDERYLSLFLSDLPRLFRYLRHLNYDILNIKVGWKCGSRFSRLWCLIFHSLRHLSIKTKLLIFKSTCLSSTHSKSKTKNFKKPRQNWVKSVTELGAMAVLQLLAANRLEN